MRAEQPFQCDCVTPGNGYCKPVMTSTAESKRVFWVFLITNCTLRMKMNFQCYSYLPLLFIFTNHSARAGYDTRSILKRSLTGLNSAFSFSLTSCLTKAEEPSLSYHLPIAGGRIIGFIAFPRVLVLCEMQLAWSRI